MKTIKTKKVSMTQVFDEKGMVYAVTILLPTDNSPLNTDLENLKEGEVVTVIGTSKGKGFQGVVKRHRFKGGRRSHGQKHSEREAGSIGGGGRAGGRVAKGMRMAGRMGNERVTTKNLTVVKIIPDTKEILVSGSVPGRRGSVVLVRSKE